MQSIDGLASEISGYKGQIFALMKAISIVFCFIGSFMVFWKMQHGDNDVKKTIIMIVGGCVAMAVIYSIIPRMFGA